jgi:aspartate racemase
MRSIGLIGGMSWESTATYYRLINEKVGRELGGLHSAKIWLASVDFEEIERLQSSGGWERSGEILADLALRLERAGAEAVALCTNTMHKVAGQIAAGLSVPFLHMAEAIGQGLRRRSVERAALLGTRYTMEQDFLKKPIREAGVEVITPSGGEMEAVNAVIYEELCRGRILEESRAAVLAIMERLQGQGAQGAILGCTELGLLITEEFTDIPLFDTARLHAERIADFCLGG